MKTPIIVVPTWEKELQEFLKTLPLKSSVQFQTFSSSECVRQVLLGQSQMVFGNIPRLAPIFEEQWQVLLYSDGDIDWFWKGNDSFIDIPRIRYIYADGEFDQRPYAVEKLPWTIQIPTGRENRFPVELRVISDEFPDTWTDDYWGITSMKAKKRSSVEMLFTEMANRLNDIFYSSTLYRNRYPRG
jgi:hypothetical protein